MQQPLIILGRVVVVLVFLFGMPLLAIPGVLEWLREGVESPRLRTMANAPVEGSSVPPQVAHNGVSLVEEQSASEVTSALFLESVKTTETASLASSRTELEELAAKIQAQGATFYRLDRISDSPEAGYRFTAQFLRGGTPPRRMNLEATDADPRRAMQQVLAQAAEFKQR
jgi:hypothetical protein